MFHGVAPRDKDANLLNIINKTSIKSVKVVNSGKFAAPSAGK
jgi:hypothetical protein